MPNTTSAMKIEIKIGAESWTERTKTCPVIRINSSTNPIRSGCPTGMVKSER